MGTELFFNYCFLFNVVINVILSGFFCKLSSLLPIKLSTKQKFALLINKFYFNIIFFLSPWIEINESQDFQKQWEIFKDKKYKKCFILNNHTCFFDALLIINKLPFSVIYKTKTYMSTALMKIPILNTICNCIGHFQIHFKSAEKNNFSVDKEKMDIIDRSVNKHIEDGGYLTFFPEGQINYEPDKILSFRYGGMKKAIQYDVPIWNLVSYGNEKVCLTKKKLPLSGFPGKINVGFRPVAPEGCIKKIKEIKDNIDTYKHIFKDSNVNELEDYEILAIYCQFEMQNQYDELSNNNKKD